MEAMIGQLKGKRRGDRTTVESAKTILRLVSIHPDSEWRDALFNAAAARQVCDKAQVFCCWVVYALSNGNLDDTTIDGPLSLLQAACATAPVSLALVEASAAAVGALLTFMEPGQALAKKEVLITSLVAALAVAPAKPYAIGGLRLLAQLDPASTFVAKELSGLSLQ